MRYILDDKGFIALVSSDKDALIDCELGSCTEYTGAIPEGYESLYEWQCDANIRAYKIVNGDLVYDGNRDAELQKQFEIEEEENATATHKWVRNQLGKSSQVVIDEFSNNVSGTSLIILNDSGGYEIPSVDISSETATEVTVVSSNKNLLGIDAVTQTISGITFTINDDGFITLNGTSTAAIEMNLKGTSTSLDMLFLIQKESDYTISGLTNDVSLNLYNYDGADRTLISSGTNRTINLSETQKVTQATLSIASGKKFEEISIAPQIEINSSATTFEKHEESRSTAILDSNNATITNLYSYYPTTVLMADEGININVSYFKYKTLEEQLTKIETASNAITLSVSSITSDLNSLQSQVAQNQESSQESIDGILETLENGVNTVKNALVTIDVNGISVATNVSKISTLITNNTFAITSSGTNLAYFGYDEENGKSISEMDNLTIRNYFTAGYHRIEKFEVDGELRTGCFYVGGEM